LGEAIFSKEPQEGYFIWVKKQPLLPLTTCIGISQNKISQHLGNLLVVEPNLEVYSNVTCNAFELDLCASHEAQGKIILKRGASLVYEHLHYWGKGDYVEPNYEFYLAQGARLVYKYQVLNPPKTLKIKTKAELAQEAQAELKTVVKGHHSNINIDEEMILKGTKAQGSLFLRLAAEAQTFIEGLSHLRAEAESKGHLDCRGLILDSTSTIQLVPALINKDKKALLTHEASIGRVNEEELNYLRARGFSLEEAVNLIVNGFLQVT